MAGKKILSHAEIASFCSQTAMILNAGITPAEGMSIMLEDTKNEDGREILEQIQNFCGLGNTFHDALVETGVFPEYVLHMIRLGEESGNLDDVMQSLADYYERQDNISDSIRNAITYPFVMLAMMILVIIILITRVLPIFGQVYEQLGSEMTGFSKSLLNLGNAINSYTVVLIIVLALCFACYFYFGKVPSGKKMFEHFLVHFPLTKSFYESVASSRFANGIALTMSSGMDTYSSLELVSELVDNEEMKKKVLGCRDALERGDNFAEALADSGIFNKLYSRMVAVGFRTGSIDNVMNKIATRYEKEIDQKLHRIISILEPTLVIILSLIVGMILLSVILPLMGIMSSIG